MKSLVAALVLSLALSLAGAAHADPVFLHACSVSFSPGPGWQSRVLGPRAVQFTREGVTVDVMFPILDAQHDADSFVRTLERDRAMRLRWIGRAIPRVLQEQRGWMRRGRARHDGAEVPVAVTWVPMGSRLVLAVIYLPPGGTRVQEGWGHELLNTMADVGDQAH